MEPMTTLDSKNPPEWFKSTLSYLGATDLFSLSQVNKSYHELQTEWPLYWKTAVQLLGAERHICVPNALAPTMSWKSTFNDVWDLRNIWSTGKREGVEQQTTSNIRTYVRFKPDSGTTRHAECNKSFNLPLHQRIQLIKAQVSGVKSTNDALQHLRDTGGVFSQAEEKVDDSKMTCKVRVVNHDLGEVDVVLPGAGLRTFRFDGVLHASASQKEVFDCAGQNIVADFMNGQNGSLMVYGQTGSGKTYSMFGPDKEAIMGMTADKGCVPRVVDFVFHELEKRKDIEAQLYLSYVEVYGQNLFDLLCEGEQIDGTVASAQGIVTSGKCKQLVESKADCYSMLARGEEAKSKAATAMNERSTRAHTVLVLTLEQHCESTDVQLESQLFLVDLGGSEQIKRSKVSGEQQTQAININLGLLALKKVVTALNSQAKYVPYHDSKLTEVLRNGIATNCKTSVLVCADTSYAYETTQTLRFAEQCSQIKTSSKENVQANREKLLKLEEEIAQLKQVIREAESWDGGAPVGAESEYEKLSVLLLRKAQLSN